MADGIELASAYVTIIPSLKGAQKRIEDELGGVSTDAAGSKIGKGLGESIGSSLDLSSVSQKMQDVGGKLSDVGSKMMGIGAGLTAGVTVPVAGATAAIGGFALKTASAAETTEISFTTMLGSSEAALDMMEELADFAAHTPFELSGLQTATRQLLAYGFTAEDVIPMLTAVGDATAALGTGQAGIESVTRALGQMQTRGKVSAEEMLQLTEAGIPAWEYLARAIGTDTAGAMDAVTKGAVTASEGIDAIVSGMENDFGGMMEEQSKTVAGLFSNLSDAIEQPLMKLRETDAYEHFADALSDVVDSAGPFVESLLPHMQKGLDGAAGLLDKASDAMDSFAEMSEEGQANLLGMVAAAAGAGPALTVLGGALRVVGTVGSGLGSIVGKAGEAIGGLASKGTSAAGGVGKLTSGLSLLKGGLVGLGIGAFAVTVGLVADHFAKAAEHEKLLTDATMDFDGIAAQASGTLQGMKVDVDGVLNSMANLNQEAADTMAQFGADSAKLDAYVSTIERLADQTGLTASEQYELKNAVEQYNSITGGTVEVVDAANGKLSESTQAIKDNAQAWRDNAYAQAAQNLAGQYFEEQIKAAQELAKAQDELADAQEHYREAERLYAQDAAGNADLMQAAQAELDRAQQNVEELGKAYETAEDNANSFSNTAAVQASSLNQTLKDALMTLPADMQGIGLDIATNLSTGIQNGTLTVDQAAQFIKDGVNTTLSGLPLDMQQKGMDAALSLSTAISSGQITVQQAADILKAAANGTLSTLPTELQQYGGQAAISLALGMSGNQQSVTDSAKGLSDAANGGVSTLPADMTTTGDTSGKNLASSLQGNAGNVGTAGQELRNSAMGGVSSTPSDMSSTGSQAGANFASGIGSAYGSTSSNAVSLANAANSGVSGSPGNLSGIGGRAGRSYASGIGSAQGSTRSNANSLANAASSMGSGNSWAWGSHLASNFASGISAGINWVASAAWSIARAARNAIGFSVPKEGPWSGSEKGGYTSGLHLTENFADGMMAGARDVANAADYVARSADPAFASAGVSQSSASAPFSITGNNFYVREEADIYKIAQQLDVLVKRQAQAAWR